MFSDAFKSIVAAICQLVNNWRRVLLLLIMAAALLESAYLFVRTREATIFQLVETLAWLITVPLLFFVLQAASVNYVTATNNRALLRKSVRECWKLAVVTLPVVFLTILICYGLNRLQVRWGIEPSGVANRRATHTSLTILTTSRFVLVGIVAPLLLIQLWIATSENGLLSLLKRLRGVVAKSFTAESMLIYGAGSLVFLFVPYIVLNKSITAQKAWVEIALLVLRLVVSAVSVILGWMTTVGALTIAGKRTQAAVQ